MFVEQGKTQTEIHELLGVSKQSLNKWVNNPKDDWQEERSARMNSVKKRADDIKEVIALNTERRLAIFNEIKEAQEQKDGKTVAELRREAVAIGQEVAMYSKALEAMDKSSKPSLALYLEIMDDIFKALNLHDSATYLKTLDFQEKHIPTVVERLA